MTNYKGYVGKFDVDIETGLVRGKVINTRDVITFHGATVREAEQAFRESVDDYLAFCEDLGETPEKPYSGKLMLRVPPKLHQELDVLAKSKGKSVNTLISEYLARMTRKFLPSRVRSGSSITGMAIMGPAKDDLDPATSASKGKFRVNVKTPKRKKSPTRTM